MSCAARLMVNVTALWPMENMDESASTERRALRSSAICAASFASTMSAVAWSNVDSWKVSTAEPPGVEKATTRATLMPRSLSTLVTVESDPRPALEA